MGSKVYSTSNYSSVNTPASATDSALALNASNSTINMLDGGAISGSLDLAKESVAAVADSTATFLDFVRKTNIDALQFGQKAADTAMNYVSETTNKGVVAEKQTNWTLWVFAGLAALYLLRGNLRA